MGKILLTFLLILLMLIRGKETTNFKILGHDLRSKVSESPSPVFPLGCFGLLES